MRFRSTRGMLTDTTQQESPHAIGPHHRRNRSWQSRGAARSAKLPSRFIALDIGGLATSQVDHYTSPRAPINPRLAADMLIVWCVEQHQPPGWLVNSLWFWHVIDQEVCTNEGLIPRQDKLFCPF